MPVLRTRLQQPTAVPAQVDLPPEFPAIPQEVLDRFPSAMDWQTRLNEFWTRSSQAIQQAQQQTANVANSRLTYSVDSFRIYAKNGIPQPMFALDSVGIKLADVLVISTVGRKVFIGEGIYADAQTPFYIDADGKFSLGANLTWDPDTATLTITGIINATSGTIGGFSIGTDYIRDVANSFGLASTVTGGDDVRFWAGSTFANRATAPFRIYESGVITVGPGASYQYNNIRMVAAITSLNNFFIGPSGNFTMTGVGNFAVGNLALDANTSGGNNIAIGTQSLFNNTSGGSNTALGTSSLFANTTGNSNTAVGVSALFGNTTGWYNVAMGINSLVANTTGYGNVAVGYGALLNLNITANDGSGMNTAVGFNTGLGIVTGVNNTILGAGVVGLAAALTGNIILAIGDGTIKCRYDGTSWVLTGGIDSTAIGANTPAAAVFTSLKATALAGVGTRNVVVDAAGVMSAP